MTLRGMSTSHRKIIQKCVGNMYIFANPKLLQCVVLINLAKGSLLLLYTLFQLVLKKIPILIVFRFRQLFLCCLLSYTVDPNQ